MSDAIRSDGVNFDVYYPDDNTPSNKIASLPCDGPLFSGWQAPQLQNAKHNATNGNAPVGHGYRVVCSIRKLEPFQSNEEMWHKRMRDFQIPQECALWGATSADYNKHTDGLPFSGLQSQGLAAFPGIGSSFVGAARPDVAGASRRIKLKSDRWPVHSLAQHGSDIARILHSDIQVLIDCKTWEILASAPILKRLMSEQQHFIIVKQEVKTVPSASTTKEDSVVIEHIQFGPLLEESSEGLMSLVAPLTVFGARQTAACLHLVHKDQNHSICRNDPRLLSDVLLSLLVHNDVGKGNE